MTSNLRIMTWNIGFGSRKKNFEPKDEIRIKKVIEVINKFDVDIIALQEMSNKRYNDKFFSLSKFIEEKDGNIYFEPVISNRKVKETNEKLDIIWQETGLGIWIYNINNWYLRNLYDDKTSLSTVEIQRPLPHPLYMGDNKLINPGRDEMDRPVLWSRIDRIDNKFENTKIYFISLHLPTLKYEEDNREKGDLTNTQKDIAINILRLDKNEIINKTVDDIGSELREYCLRHIIAQTIRIENFWKDDNQNCIFILAGDFNFYHTNKFFPNKTLEEKYLIKEGFTRSKKSGYTRQPKHKMKYRLVDNIWIKDSKNIIKEINEYIIKNDNLKISIEEWAANEGLDRISDHYPVIVYIEF